MIFGGRAIEQRTRRTEKPFLGNGIVHGEDAPLMTFQCRLFRIHMTIPNLCNESLSKPDGMGPADVTYQYVSRLPPAEDIRLGCCQTENGAIWLVYRMEQARWGRNRAQVSAEGRGCSHKVHRGDRIVHRPVTRVLVDR